VWSEENLCEDLRALGLSEGMHVAVHASMRAIGPTEGGSDTLVRSLRRTLGKSGTLLVPTFTPEFFDPAESEAPPSIEEIEKLRSEIGVFDCEATPASQIAVGVFPEAVRRQPDAHRSDHPVCSFGAVGALAESLTAHVPFHYPLGSDSPIARLHRYKGWAVLIGVGHDANAALHLAEVWADVPYIHNSARVKIGTDRWLTMQGRPGCTDGFSRIEPVLRQARIIHTGQVGNARAQLMRLEEMVSMAVAILQGAGDSLLCDDPNCPTCRVARRYTAESTYVTGHAV